MFKETEEMRKTKLNQIYQLEKNLELNQALNIMEKEDFSYNLEWNIRISELYSNLKGYNTALDLLLKIEPKYELNSKLQYTIAFFYDLEKNYSKAIRHFIKALCDNSISEERSKMISDYILEFVKMEKIDSAKVNDIFNEEKRKLGAIHKLFPCREVINGKEISYVGNAFFIGKNQYFTGLYDYYQEERYFSYYKTLNNHFTYKIETLKGQLHKKIKKVCEEKSVIPLMPLYEGQKIELSSNDNNINLIGYYPNRYYYYTFQGGDKVQISSKENFVAGEFLPLVHRKNRPKLILNIFVDGLAKKFTEDYGLEECMPNTYEFFSKGTICKNAYANAEWTQPSIASFFSGKYLTNHRMYHPDYSSENLYNIELFPEILEKEGYLCGKIDGDWRSTPIMGYVKGMKREVYQASVLGMHSDEVLAETIEHLEAFKEADNFLWICLPDLHDIADEYEDRISTQIMTPLSFREIKHSDASSVRKGYDIVKIERFRHQLKRMDTMLLGLYAYLEKHYKQDEYVISMMSDHGQGFMIPEGREFLSEQRTKITMMFRGKDIPKGECKEFIEGIDLFPILLNCAGINGYDLKDGNIPVYFGGNKERAYALTESIFPSSPYRCTLNYKNYIFYFSSEGNCSYDGRFMVGDFKVRIMEKETGLEITDHNKIAENTEIVLEHCKEYIM